MAKIEEYSTENGKRWRWKGYVCTIEGKQKNSKREGFLTKEEAAASLEAYKSKLLNKENKKYTFQMLFDDFIAYKNKRVKQCTVRNYTNVYKSILKARIIDEGAQVESLTNRKAQQITDKISEHFKNETPYITMLKNLFSYAVKIEIIEKNPFQNVDRIRKESKQEKKNSFTRDELRAFLIACDELKNKQFSALFHLLAFTGMRQGEARALKWKDIDLKGKTVSINKTVSVDRENKEFIESSAKTKGSNRVITLSDDIVSRLAAIKRNRNENELVFYDRQNKLIAPSSLRYNMKKACEAAGVDYIGLHGLRHTFVSLAIESGIEPLEVAHIVGHSSLDMIMKVYDTFTNTRSEQATEQFQTYIERG